jgi:hypothetical protein
VLIFLKDFTDSIIHFCNTVYHKCQCITSFTYHWVSSSMCALNNQWYTHISAFRAFCNLIYNGYVQIISSGFSEFRCLHFGHKSLGLTMNLTVPSSISLLPDVTAIVSSVHILRSNQTLLSALHLLSSCIDFSFINKVFPFHYPIFSLSNILVEMDQIYVNFQKIQW